MRENTEKPGQKKQKNVRARKGIENVKVATFGHFDPKSQKR